MFYFRSKLQLPLVPRAARIVSRSIGPIKSRIIQMNHGGKRSGAGRPKGAKSAKTLEIARKAIESGLTPLEFMMDILRDVNQPKQLRFEAAKSAAPYIHPRLAHIESKNETAVTNVVSPEPTLSEWKEEFTDQRPN